MEIKDYVMIAILIILMLLSSIVVIFVYRSTLSKAYIERVLIETIHNSLTTLSNSVTSYLRIGYSSNLVSSIQTIVSFEIERRTKLELLLGRPLSAMNFTELLEQISRDVFESINWNAVDDELSVYSREYINKLITNEVTIQLYMLTRETQHRDET